MAIRHRLTQWEFVGILNLPFRTEVYFIQEETMTGNEKDIFFNLYLN